MSKQKKQTVHTPPAPWRRWAAYAATGGIGLLIAGGLTALSLLSQSVTATIIAVGLGIVLALIVAALTSNFVYGVIYGKQKRAYDAQVKFEREEKAREKERLDRLARKDPKAFAERQAREQAAMILSGGANSFEIGSKKRSA